MQDDGNVIYEGRRRVRGFVSWHMCASCDILSFTSRVDSFCDSLLANICIPITLTFFIEFRQVLNIMFQNVMGRFQIKITIAFIQGFTVVQFDKIWLKLNPCRLSLTICNIVSRISRLLICLKNKYTVKVSFTSWFRHRPIR